MEKIVIVNNKLWFKYFSPKKSNTNGSPIIIQQLAGAGRPWKYLCSFFYKLNFDNLNAVAIVIKNPTRDIGEK